MGDYSHQQRLSSGGCTYPMFSSPNNAPGKMVRGEMNMGFAGATPSIIGRIVVVALLVRG